MYSLDAFMYSVSIHVLVFRSLYATYGKKYGMFVDNPHSSQWHRTWQLAVTLAEAMQNNAARKDSIG